MYTPKEYLYIAADVARQWDPEFASFYDRLTKKGFHHYAICALANKMAARVYAVLKRMQRDENSNYKSSYPLSAEDQPKPQEVEYKLIDLDGNVVTKKEARKIVQSKFPRKSQRKKNALDDAKNQKKLKKNSKNLCQKQNDAERQKESLSSREPFSVLTRQLFRALTDDSSTRSCKTLSVIDVLKG